MPNSASMSTYTTMMRVNSKGRPYAKDLYDLFSALLIQQPLTDHRSLFRTYPSTFTTDEAVESLGHLEFTHLVSTPNPIDPSNPIVTRTTTTFSMSRDMAKTLGQHFINARLAENATDPQNRAMKDRGIWQPTPKGKFMIQDFSYRARVSIKHMQSSLARIQSFPIIVFERLLDDDQLSFSRPNIIDAFKTMMEYLPTDTIMIDDIGGVKNENILEYEDCFYGYQCFEWISEYTTVVSKEEAEMVATEFIQYGWISQILDKSDRDLGKKDDTITFKSSKKTQYYLTNKGRQILECPANQFIPLGTSIPPSSRSRTQSSATVSSSSNSSILTNNSQIHQKPPSIKSRKEECASRLLPTTMVTPLEDTTMLVPKAIITKQKTTETEDNTASPSYESTLQIEGNCDFGFSSASSTTSSIGVATFPSTSDILGKDQQSQLQEQMNHLRVSTEASIKDSPTNRSLCYLFGDQVHIQPNSQDARLQNILEDPLIRMYFRQFLKSCFCEENVNFWVDYTALIKKLSYSVDEDQAIPNKDQIPDKLCQSLLKHCCSIYNNYFCPDNAPSELNIDHGLRYDIIQYMQATFTNQVSGDESSDPNEESTAARNNRKKPAIADASNVPFGSISVSTQGVLSSSAVPAPFRKKRRNRPQNGTLTLKESIRDSPQTCLFYILHLYDQANRHICRIMAEDSVPRFMKTPKYKELMKSYYQTAANSSD